MRELEKCLKALANRRRLAILKYLQKKKEASVAAISEEIELSFRSTSKHLQAPPNIGLPRHSGARTAQLADVLLSGGQTKTGRAAHPLPSLIFAYFPLWDRCRTPFSTNLSC
ncbi:MAG: helix-turn-helix transcriptional regulator [Candidatus Liptonbacteria bacterium]|nr:helix-turn-helix transcriptional regulator [Candidatus Liptonbacteria bacterium]